MLYKSIEILPWFSSVLGCKAVRIVQLDIWFIALTILIQSLLRTLKKKTQIKLVLGSASVIEKL